MGRNIKDSFNFVILCGYIDHVNIVDPIFNSKIVY